MYREHLLYVIYTKTSSQKNGVTTIAPVAKLPHFSQPGKTPKNICEYLYKRYRALQGFNGRHKYIFNETRVPEAFLVLPNLLWLVLPLGRTWAKE